MRDMSERAIIALNSGKRSVDGGAGEDRRQSLPPEGGRLAADGSAAQGCEAWRYFPTVESRKLLDEILTGLAGQNSVYLVEGGEGCGKSAFLRWLRQQVPRDWTVCHMHASKALGEKHLLAALNGCLFPGEVLDSGTLAARLKQRLREGERILVTVDDAERLSPFALKTLFVIKEAVEKRGDRLGVVLAAGPAVRNALATPSLSGLARERVRRLLLPPFTYQQTQDYIRHCLQAAGAEQDIVSSRRLMRRIFRLSGGFPKTVDMLMQEIRNGGVAVQHSPFLHIGDRLTRYRVFMFSVLAFGVLVLAAYGIYRGLPVAAPQAPDVAALQADDLRELMALPGVAPEADAPVEPQPAMGVDDAEAERPVPSAPQTGVKTTAKAASPPPAVLQRPAQEIKPSPPPPAEQRREPGGIRDSRWVLAQDARHFTVQLTSWEDETRARKYIERNGLENQAAYVHTRSKGKDWYLVVYNTYPTLSEARQAIRELPAPLKKYGPWVRNISSLQAEAVSGQGRQ